MTRHGPGVRSRPLHAATIARSNRLIREPAAGTGIPREAQ
jgi:hypothetical protein